MNQAMGNAEMEEEDEVDPQDKFWKHALQKDERQCFLLGIYSHS
jgi:hypothetical protein